jgi:hypothetical protein
MKKPKPKKVYQYANEIIARREEREEEKGLPTQAKGIRIVVLLRSLRLTVVSTPVTVLAAVLAED